MASQFDLFAPKAVASTAPPRASGCQRQPGPACPRVASGQVLCPGRAACEVLGEQEAERIRAAEAARAARPAPAPELACLGCGDGFLSVKQGGLCGDTSPSGPCPNRPSLPAVVAQANVELGEDADSMALLARAQELARGATARVCGGCGCSDSDHPITLYESGPLAGSYRCWPCAKGVLQP